MDKIHITYFGDDAPIIKCDNLADMERIELIDGEEAHWLFLKHGGVSVYHTSKHGNDGPLSDYWFSALRGESDDSDMAFDVHDLPVIPGERFYIYDALYGEDEKQRMAYAIDIGLITREGLSDACRDCGVPIGEAGDGYDGRCGNCADKAEKQRQKIKGENQ